MLTIAELKQIEDKKVVLANLMHNLRDRYATAVKAKESAAHLEFHTYFQGQGFQLLIEEESLTASYFSLHYKLEHKQSEEAGRFILITHPQGELKIAVGNKVSSSTTSRISTKERSVLEELDDNIRAAQASLDKLLPELVYGFLENMVGDRGQRVTFEKFTDLLEKKFP